MAKNTTKQEQAKSKKKKKKGNGGKIVALFLALAVAAGYFFKDCLPNFGLGTGTDLGTAKQEAPEETTPPVTAKPEGEQAGVVTVTVKVEECIVDGQAPAPCPKVCEDLEANTAKDTRIKVDPTHGAHGVVETLKTCLGDAGFTDVTTQAE